MKQALTVCFLLFIFYGTAAGNHYLGGEVSWECTEGGHYRFRVVLYRECHLGISSAPTTFPEAINLRSNAPGFTTIYLHRQALQEITPMCGCPGGIGISCYDTINGQPRQGAVERHVYTSDVSYPLGVPLTGTPPATGWWFGYGACCRTAHDNMDGLQQLSYMVQAVMYPYKGRPANQCFDNSPVFAETPAPVFCATTPHFFPQFGHDPDGDSLVWTWSNPSYNQHNSPINTYLPGYSFDAPLPGTSHHIDNVPAGMNPVTGEISFKSHTAGSFVTVSKVTAYRNTIKVSETFRELPFIVTHCDTNHAPVVFTTLPLIQGSGSVYRTSVVAGDSITIGIWGHDNDLCPDTIVVQSMHLTAISPQFGTLINGTPCKTAPCATLTPSPDTISPLVMTGNLNTLLQWQTGSEHLAIREGLFAARSYPFYFFIRDDQCPVPQAQRIEIIVDVLPPPTIQSAEIICLEVLENGDVMLQWDEFGLSPGLFNGYALYGSTLPGGPFTVLATGSQMSDSIFFHQGTTSKTSPIHYYIRTENSLQPYNPYLPGGIASTIWLKASPSPDGSGNTKLEWNAPHQHSVTGSTGVYSVYQRGGVTPWSLVGTTPETFFTDTVTYPHLQVQYQVRTATSGATCFTVSNIASVHFSDIQVADPGANAPLVFPNPASRQLILHPEGFTGMCRISLLTLTGQKAQLWERELSDDAPETLQLPDLPAGVYLLRIDTGDRKHIQRLVIVKD